MIKVIGYQSKAIGNEVLVEDSQGQSVQSSNPDELLSFISKDYSDKPNKIWDLKMAFDLDVFITPILKMLGVTACRELANDKHSYKGIFYIPAKVLRLEYGEHKSYIYHLQQYFPDLLNDDLQGIVNKTNEVLKALQSINMSSLALTSPIAIYEKQVLDRLNVPTIIDVPTGCEECITYAEECCRNSSEWVESFQVGHWNDGEVWQYDIASAFPYYASKLYDIRYSTFTKSNELIPSTYGFLHGKVTIYENINVSPILYRDEKDSMISPVGSWDTYITLDKLNFIKKWGIGEFKLYDGWFINFKAPVKPLEIPMQRLFNLRQQGDMVKSLVKRMAVGVAGKFLERHDDNTVGKYYNPIYAAQVRTQAMLQLAQFIYSNELQDSLVHVGVDSAMTTKRVILQQQSGMGTWREDNIGATLVMSSGRVYHGVKKPQGLNYDQIFKLIKDNPKETYYTMGLMRPQTLAESIQINDFEGLGRMKDTDSSFDLNLLQSDQDRIFQSFPITGSDLLNKKYSSKPIIISH